MKRSVEANAGADRLDRNAHRTMFLKAAAMASLRSHFGLVVKAIPVFLFGFVVFFGVGFLTGWDARERNAQAEAYAGLRYGTDSSGASVLDVDCDASGIAYHYDVETNDLRSDTTGLQAVVLRNPSDENKALRTAALAFFGGPAGAVSHRTFVEAWKKSKQQARWPYLVRLVTGILGGISGYSLGYWQGSTWAIDCDSELGRYVLADEAAWRIAEKNYFQFSILEMEMGEHAKIFAGEFENRDFWETDPLFLCETAFATASASLLETDDPGADAFQRLVALVATYRVARNGKAYLHIQKHKLSHLLIKEKGIDRVGNIVEQRGYDPEAFAGACADLRAEITQRINRGRTAD